VTKEDTNEQGVDRLRNPEGKDMRIVGLVMMVLGGGLVIGFNLIGSLGPVPWDTGTTVIIWGAVAIVGLILFSRAQKPPPRNGDSGVGTNEIP